MVPHLGNGVVVVHQFFLTNVLTANLVVQRSFGTWLQFALILRNKKMILFLTSYLSIDSNQILGKIHLNCCH